MKSFVINMARRRDRWSVMTAQLKALGLSFERVAACDAQRVNDEWLSRYFRASGPLGVLTNGDKCCSLSHRRAWAALLSSGAPYGVILEDDVALDPAAGEMLRRHDWIPAGVELLKLEHFGPPGQRVLVGEPMAAPGGRSIAEIFSRHTGGGAYVLSRAAAELLMSLPAKWSISVDHILFNPNVSPMAGQLRPWQLLPAIARQDPALGGPSDIASARAVYRKPTLAYFKREIVRAYYETRLLPQQIFRLVTGRGALVRVQNKMLIHTPTKVTIPSLAQRSGGA
jgi:glycosyl transferase, family 25